MDALSNVISILRVESAVSSRFEARGRWAFRFPNYRHLKFGSVIRGQLHLRMEGKKETHVIDEGDFYLLTNGQPFISSSDPTCMPMDGPRTYATIRGPDGVVRFDGPGSTAPMVLASGRFVFEDDPSALLLAQLPPLIHLRACEISRHALSHVLALLRMETDLVRPASDVAKSGLATLVFVHALRAFMESSDGSVGWLGALADKRIGAALSLMHARPAQRWTVEELAANVGMSRTAFAQRFRTRVGSAPLEYLQAWRMSLAKSALAHSSESITQIAERVGYLSDTAFSIAFKRSTGSSPGRYRHAKGESTRGLEMSTTR